MRTFVHTASKSNTFWHIALTGASFTVTFGRVGTTGRTNRKDFTTAAAARAEHNRLVAEKLKKGYVETTPPVPAPTTDRRAFEAALAAHPDEAAAHHAYADYLTEQDDPRGEFIQVQLALEDETRPKKERNALRKREEALLKKYARTWLGDAGRFLVGTWCGPDQPYEVRFARGWLDYVRMLPFPEPAVAAVAGAPEARLLRHLEVVHNPRDTEVVDDLVRAPAGMLRADEQHGTVYSALPTLSLLASAPNLTNLRVLRYGFTDHEHPYYDSRVTPFPDCTAEQLIALLEKCPRLTELYFNTRMNYVERLFASSRLGALRVLQYYYGTRRSRFAPTAYPLGALADNKALTSLTTLRLCPGSGEPITLAQFDALLHSKNLPALTHLRVQMSTFGDLGAMRIANSGILKRLKTLDISYGCMSDDGARTLANSPDLKNLDVLDVSVNALTNAGISALRQKGIRIVAADQHDGDDQYLYSADPE
jgi:uncharacterized protein (TIGR02996 family)